MNSKSEVWRMKEDEAQEVLIEYYKQTTEDCRTVGVQRTYVMISFAIMFSSLLFEIVSIKNDDKSINNLNSFEPVYIIFTLIFIVVILFFIFFNLHLPILDKNVRKIEELHRDILFGEMGDRYLFCWDNIPGSDNHLITEFLIEAFNVKWVKNAKIEKKDNDMVIKLSTAGCLNTKIFTKKKFNKAFKSRTEAKNLQILDFWDRLMGCIFKKSLSFTLNNEKNTVILTINKMTDEFYIKNEEKLKVFEPELKYRFREIYPHLNVYNQWNRLTKKVGLVIFGSVIFAIFLITILIMFKSILNYI